MEKEKEERGAKTQLKLIDLFSHLAREIALERLDFLSSEEQEERESRAGSSINYEDPFLPTIAAFVHDSPDGRLANVAVAERRDDNETAARKRWHDVWKGSPRGEGPGGSCSEAKSHGRGREQERREARGPAEMNEARE